VSALRFISNRRHTGPRTSLPNCPAGHARVAIYTHKGHLSQVVLAEVIDGVVMVKVLGERVVATPCKPIPAASGARYRITMPVWGEAEP
jgi:phage terminase large subunit-like protein